MSRATTLAAIIVAALLLSNGWSQIPDISINKPECMSWDSLYNRYLVSLNLDNDVVQVDQIGVVTPFLQDIGTYITSAGIGGTTFYQSDMDQITGFDLATGERVFFVNIPTASYIAGAVADTSGNIYVPDMPSRANPAVADMIWKIRLSDSTVSKLVTTDDGLGFQPRDMVFDPVENRLIVTFMKAPVYIQSVSLNDLTITNLARFKTDYTNGIARDQFGNIYVAGYDNGIIYRYDSAFSTEPEIISKGHDSPCNIDYNPQDHILAVPCYWGDLLQFLPMGRPDLNWASLSDVNGGDGDGFAEAGETVEMVVTLTNTHFLPLTDVSVELIGVTGGLTIIQSSVTIGTVPSRSNMDHSGSPLELSIPSGAENQMVSFDFELTYTSDYGTEIDTIRIEKPIGIVSILVVNDDSGPSDLDRYYRDALTLMDSTYEVWPASYGPPEPAFMSRFDVVIWFTGDKQPSLLDADEITVIKNYLDEGGNLLLTGQGIAGQLDTLDQPFLHDYLHAEFLGGSYWPFMAADTGGSIFDPSDRFTIAGSAGANNQVVSDHIGPVNGGVAELKYEGKSDWSGVSYDGNYRLLFLSFGFEAITNDNPSGTDRDLIMPKILNFFDWVNPYHCCTGLTGNVNYDPEDIADMGDLTSLISYLFIPPYPMPVCEAEANINGEGGVDIGDLTAMIDYLFITYAPPEACP